MDIRQIAERWMPPALVDWYHSIRHGRKNQGYIWEGVYQRFQDVPVKGPGYRGDHLTQETFAYTKKILEEAQQGRLAFVNDMGEHFFLPLLVAFLGCFRDAATILDFGGGMGIEYVYLIHSIHSFKNVEYFVVENPAVCDAGSLLHQKDSRIHFYSSLPTDIRNVDIVYMNSALQYVEDYGSLLKKLCAYRPEFFLFVKLSAGDIPTYATSQRNLSGSQIPYWFINIDEVKLLMEENGYSLIYKSTLERQYDQSNFSTINRLGHACNLLFKRLPPNE